MFTLPPPEPTQINFALSYSPRWMRKQVVSIINKLPGRGLQSTQDDQLSPSTAAVSEAMLALHRGGGHSSSVCEITSVRRTSGEKTSNVARISQQVSCWPFFLVIKFIRPMYRRLDPMGQPYRVSWPAVSGQDIVGLYKAELKVMMLSM